MKSKTKKIIFIYISSSVFYLLLSSFINNPGHGDPSFYYTVSESLAKGEGFQIDYVWNFLNGLPPISHPSNAYWMPLPSLIMAIPMFFLGTSFQAAQIPVALFSAMLPTISYLFCRKFFNEKVAIFSSIITLMHPAIVTNAVSTNRIIFSAVFISLILLLLSKKLTSAEELKTKTCLLIGVLAGLGYLTSSSSSLIFVTILITLFLYKMWHNIGWSNIFKKLVSIIASALAVVLPWLARNMMVFSGTGSSAIKTAFLTHYEQLYSYNVISMENYLEWGIYNIVISKVEALISNLASFGKGITIVLLHSPLGFLLGIIIFSLFLFTLFRFIRRKNYPPLTFLIHFFVLFAFLSLIFTFTGGGTFNKSVPIFIPFTFGFVVYGFKRVLENIQERLPNSFSFFKKKSLSTVLLIFVLVGLFSTTIYFSKSMINSRNDMERRYGQINQVLERNIGGNGIIMTRNPWELHHYTGFKSVQIPNNQEGFVPIAKRYDIKAIITNRSTPQNREYLNKEYISSTCLQISNIFHIKDERKTTIFEVTFEDSK